jgi:hypothetical protein
MASLDNRVWSTLAIAVPCLVFGIFDFLRTAAFVLHAESANAVVVSESTRHNGQYRTFKGYPEVVTFSDPDGNAHTATVYYGQPGHHPKGTSVKILYKLYDPAGTARYAYFGQLWMLSTAMLAIGLMGTTGAFVIRARGY